MNFVLKGTDVLEPFTHRSSGRFGVRIVDAKFALPGDSWFVCLDMPDYPGEHDDVSFLFGSEVGMYLSFSLLSNLL